MANYRLIYYADTLAPTITATSADSSYPVTNLNIDELRKFYKAMVSGSVVDVTVDVGSGNTVSGLLAVPGIFIDWSNFASITIGGNSTSSWASPPWSAAATLSVDECTGRRKGFWKLSELNAATFAYRYLNIRIAAQSTDDGLTYFLSRVKLGSITELGVNFAYEPERGLKEAREVTPLLDGGTQVTELGDDRMTITFPHISRDEASLTEMLRMVRYSKDPFVLWDAGLGGGSQNAWLMRRLEESRQRQRFNAMHNSQISFVEVG